MPPPTKKAKAKKSVAPLILKLMLLCSLSFSLFTWWRFHPSGVIAVVGPAGQTNWAFIQTGLFGDPASVLRVSDFPHTLIQPLPLGEVEGAKSRAFWSADGSVLVTRGSDEQYQAAYDFTDHRTLHHWVDITELLKSRGGLGPEQPNYPGGKSEKGS